MRNSSVIRKELEEAKNDATSELLDADEKAFIQDKKKELEDELEKALGMEGSQKKAPEKKEAKAPVKKPLKTPAKEAAKTPAKTKEKAFIMFEGKKIFEDDANYCENLVKAWEARKAARKKAEGKRKTKPVTQRVASNVASAITTGIKSISNEEIKENPNKIVSDIEKLEKAAKDFLEAFKTVLGEKITQKEIKEEFEGIDKMISEIKKKYGSKKKSSYEKGGDVEINSVSELYDLEEASNYPYARDMVAYFIFGDKDDNIINKAIKGVYSEDRADESQLSEIMLGY